MPNTATFAMLRDRREALQKINHHGGMGIAADCSARTSDEIGGDTDRAGSRTGVIESTKIIVSG